MGIALLTLSQLFNLLHQLPARLGGTQRPRPAPPKLNNPYLRATALAAARCKPLPAHAGAERSAPVRLGLALQRPLRCARPLPLRVLRITDSQAQPGNVGRLVISGRMADVCAELDRLAALEARQALH